MGEDEPPAGLGESFRPSWAGRQDGQDAKGLLPGEVPAPGQVQAEVAQLQLLW